MSPQAFSPTLVLLRLLGTCLLSESVTSSLAKLVPTDKHRGWAAHAEAKCEVGIFVGFYAGLYCGYPEMVSVPLAAGAHGICHESKALVSRKWQLQCTADLDSTLHPSCTWTTMTEIPRSVSLPERQP